MKSLKKETKKKHNNNYAFYFRPKSNLRKRIKYDQELQLK